MIGLETQRFLAMEQRPVGLPYFQQDVAKAAVELGGRATEVQSFPVDGNRIVRSAQLVEQVPEIEIGQRPVRPALEGGLKASASLVRVALLLKGQAEVVVGFGIL